MEVLRITREDMNKVLDFKYFCTDMDKIERYILLNNELISFNSNDSFRDIDLDSFELETSELFNSQKDLLNIILKFKINETLALTEEVYIHSDYIERNIKTIEYIKQLLEVLKD